MQPDSVTAAIHKKEREAKVVWFSIGATVGVLYMLAVVFICTRIW